MKLFIRSLSVLFAVILAMTMSFAVLADENDVVSDSSTVTSSEAVSDDSSAAVSDDESAEASTDESTESSDSSEASKEESKDESKTETSTNSNASTSTGTTENTGSDISWARIITLIAIVVLIAVAIILAKTNTALGRKISKFFKEYWSEIKKVSWYSPKDTAKATGIVLVFIIGAAVAIGLLDLAFTKIVQGLANIF